MPFGSAFRKTILDAYFNGGTPHLSLHTGHPGDTGTNEATGGSYARQPTAFDAASGTGTTANTAQEEFTGMPACTVYAVGVWSALAGTWRGYGWLGGHAAKPFTALNAGDVFRSPAHGYSNDDRVVLEDPFGTLPTGSDSTTIYYIVGVTTDTFQISTSSGGAAVTLTSDGTGLVRKVVPKVVNSGDTFRIAAGDCDVTLVA